MTDWSEVRPVLEAVVEAQTGSQFPSAESEGINQALGRDADDPRVDVLLRELKDGDYITGHRDGDAMWSLVQLTEKGRIEVEGWPQPGGGEPFDLLLGALEDRIANASDADERTRLERFRDGLVDLAKGIGKGAVSALIAQAVTSQVDL